MSTNNNQNNINQQQPQQVVPSVQSVINGIIPTNNNPNAVQQTQQQEIQASKQQQQIQQQPIQQQLQQQQQQHQQQNQQQLQDNSNKNVQQKDHGASNNQIQIVNLNLKCEEHTKEQIVGICFAQNCEYSSRLLCLQCIFSQHAEHVKHSVQIKDIDETEKNGIFMDNWPTQQICKDIRKFIKKSQLGSYTNLEQKIENLKLKAANSFVEIQNIIKEKTKNINLSKETEINKLNKESQNMFKLNGLRLNIKEYSEKKINKGQLNIKIKEFLQEKPSEEDLHKLNNVFIEIKQNQELIFVPNEFERIESEILNLISSIPSQVLLSNSINFSASPFKDSAQHFKVGEKGSFLSFENDSTSSFVICMSDKLKKKSQYDLELKIDGDYTNNKIYLSIVNEEFIDELPQNFYYCLVRGQNDMKGEFQMLGQEWLHVKNLKNSIKVKICISQNIFQIQSSDERGGVQLMNYKFNCTYNKNWRLMIVNQGKPIKINKISSSVDHF